MIGFDLYPLQNWCRPERLVDVYLSQRARRSRQGKPTFQWIEAAGMTCPHDGPTAVTPATVRAESWLAIAGGAKGLGFFPPAAWTGDVGEAIAEVTSTVRGARPRSRRLRRKRGSTRRTGSSRQARGDTAAGSRSSSRTPATSPRAPRSPCRASAAARSPWSAPVAVYAGRRYLPRTLPAAWRTRHTTT